MHVSSAGTQAVCPKEHTLCGVQQGPARIPGDNLFVWTFAARLAGANGEKVRLVCVPSFLSSGTLVLVNLRTLEAQPMTFQSIYS